MVAQSLFLGLGSNLGDRADNLRRAVRALEADGRIAVQQISPVYETAPWGKTDQPPFLNLCLEARSDLPPQSLLQEIKALERELGREPGERWGPRLIDIDILAYGDEVVQEESLTVPHPALADRPFVLAPLADIAPDWTHPVHGEKVSDMLARHDLAGVRRLPLPLLWGRRTYAMGILNVTPDSFSGDGLLAGEDTVAAAVRQAEAFVRDGADIIDIGGESTRPGSEPVTIEEELARLLPVLRAVRAQVRVPISVDTYRADVAAAALAEGADWVNDIWGLRMDKRMAGVVAEAGCPVVIMHNRSRPKSIEQEDRLGGRYLGAHYDDLLTDIGRELEEQVAWALAEGVRPKNIIIDPGIGFGKSISQHLQLIDQLDAFKALGYPILIGPSRKSFIGYTLNLPPEERLEGTAAVVAIGIDRGADIIRVHDVRAMVRVARMTDRIVRRGV